MKQIVDWPPLVRQRACHGNSAPTVIGIDDWAKVADCLYSAAGAVCAETSGVAASCG